MSKQSLYSTDDHRYDIKLENFDGPLDLLLMLVQEKNVDIMDVDVSELAMAYLNIIQNLQEHEIDVASDYLVMAATLLALKTKMLFYTPEEKPEIEEDKRELLRRLYEYQQIKEVTTLLREKEKERTEIFIKKPSDIEEFLIDDDKSTLDGNSTPLKLITILRKMFERTYAQQLRKAKLETFNLTPKDQIPFILNLFDSCDKVSFEMIFNQPSLNHFVITFLAILDLTRRQIIRMYQDEQFSSITFERGPEYEK
ncbi:segregation/condensation protein A [Mycoplasma tauri]|uniref:Segregation and condensation protein A n=1 Tax=Mycoplasma tauri TaxID=547987 RepID=A0A953NCZ5_9MOLU|nr:segregation/condensation protein A [Mycoplasma tauri]MBZ4195199.1 segregation/condensation protein A [Mycoplasma tauri]MBZ4203920.1 segregation/condensation protein A [Mycoplasma tauri]MBZ4204195.1 segregation/condensation protein A [Mycoplasma tauri]MBZ4212744.1 segregation/condensation protein A [Mycoplasma tauri]MBZ4217988.1 segregation/condensation protein A [Mycoplasma tauri]